MASSKAVEKVTSTEVSEREALEAELAAENAASVDASDIQIPLLKIGQALTVEVADGDATPGEFINALTREGLGREIEFVVAGYTKGRFDHGDRSEGKRARKAYGIKNVPWSDDPFYGAPFTEHPDAEEKYSERVNNGDIQWAKGPRISTTYDFTGFVVPESEDETPIPVCLSLMRMNTKQAKKWVTILDAVLRSRYWDAVFTLTTDQQRGEQGNFYTINVRQTRKTTPHEKQLAVDLAVRLRNQSVQIVGEEDEAAPRSEPAAAEGAMEV